MEYEVKVRDEWRPAELASESFETEPDDRFGIKAFLLLDTYMVEPYAITFEKSLQGAIDSFVDSGELDGHILDEDEIQERREEYGSVVDAFTAGNAGEYVDDMGYWRVIEAETRTV